MADHADQIMRKLHAYAEDIRSAMTTTAITTASETSVLADAVSGQAYEQQLGQTIQELRERLKQQRLALDQIKVSTNNTAITKVSADKRTKLHQLRVVRSAFDRLAQSEPFLPRPGSALPTALALRTLQRTIAGSKDAIATTRRDLATTRAQLQHEHTSLAEAQTIKAALETRIARLKRSATDRSNTDPTDAADKLIGVRQARKLVYERETLKLHDALVKFTRDHLGVMVAAEELGGPVVGESLDFADAELAGGFPTGKKRKVRELDLDERQMRMDEIWGASGSHEARDHEHEHDHGVGKPNEREAAAREVHGLIERLIQALIGTTGEGVYIMPGRDSAAARFLIRARIAEYHPKDARKMRLIDFGREFD